GLGALSFAQIEYSFVDPSAVDWEDTPFSSVAFQNVSDGAGAAFRTYTLQFDVGCADSQGLEAAVKLPDSFSYRPRSSRLSTTVGAAAPSGPISLDSSGNQRTDVHASTVKRDLSNADGSSTA